MSNVTLVIPEDVLKRARLRAMHEDTSVNALIRDYLTAYAAEDTMAQKVEDFLTLGDQIMQTAVSDGRPWRREDAYEGRIKA